MARPKKKDHFAVRLGKLGHFVFDNMSTWLNDVAPFKIDSKFLSKNPLSLGECLKKLLQ